MKKVVLSLFLLLICIGKVVSQFDYQTSQYMFHNSSFNPAAVGDGNMIEITGQHRIQWVGMPNAGQTTVFSINSPLKTDNFNSGIGVKFINDRVGLFTNQTVHLQYAYKKQLSSGLLSIGTDLGFVSNGFHGDSLPAHTITIGDYHDLTNDPFIPKSSVAGISFDLSLGVFYSTPTYYAGISYLHINNPTVDWGDNTKFKQNGSVYLTGGYIWTLADTKYVFKPTTLIKTDFSSVQFDLSARVEYDSKFWGGIAYRLEDAVILLAGINVGSGLSIGYSYDLPVSNVIRASSGSHEIMVMYSFEYVFGKRNSKYKSIRIL